MPRVVMPPPDPATLRTTRCPHLAHWLPRAALIVPLLAALGAALGPWNAGRAEAIQPQVATDWSFYILSGSTSQAYTLGCNQGHFDAAVSPPHNSLVVLDFGVQDAGGTETETTFTGIFLSNAQVESIAEQFALAYYGCTGADTTSVLALALGTNDSVLYSGTTTFTNQGKAWANVVAKVAADNASNGISSQVTVWGANDIESWYDPSIGTSIPPADATAWVNGYASIDPAPYVNFGSADGCSESLHANELCGFGYHQSDYYFYSWGAAPALVTPEIYSYNMANEWTQISLYALTYHSGMSFEGPWDEYDLDASTLTSSQAWNALWDDLYFSGASPTMTYSAEIHQES